MEQEKHRIEERYKDINVKNVEKDILNKLIKVKSNEKLPLS